MSTLIIYNDPGRDKTTGCYGNVHSVTGWRRLLEVAGPCWVKLDDLCGCQQVSRPSANARQLHAERQ